MGYNRFVFGWAQFGVFWGLKNCFLCCFLEKTNESDDDVEEESNELGYESGYFATNGTCAGVP